jgi:hypothetical protein
MKSVMGLLLAALCGCAGARAKPTTVAAADYKAKDGTPAAAAGQPAPQGKMVCEEEMPLGSHIPRRVCRYQEDIDANRQETQEKLRAQPNVQTKQGG